MGTTSATTFDKLWAALQLDELSARSYGDEDLPAQAQVALAAVGRRSALGVALIADRPELEQSASWGPLARAVALRGYQRLGARARAQLQAAALERVAQRHGLNRALQAALQHEHALSYSAPALLAERALQLEDAPEAERVLTQGLDDACGELAPLCWLEGLSLQVGIQVARGHDAQAIALCDRFAERFPHSDGAALWRMVAAFIELHAGESSRLRQLARTPADDAPWSEPIAKGLLQSLELAGGALHWLHAAQPSAVGVGHRVELEGRAVLRRVLGDAHIQNAPRSLAGLRAALRDRGVPSARLRLTRERLPALLGADAQVILAEERSIGTGFARVVGYETATGLLLVERFSQVGAALRRWQDQSRRSQLHGMGALVIGFPEDLHDLHDATLDVLDACEPERRHAHAGRARAAHQTAEAVRACSDVPRAHQLRGEALIEQLRAGELETSRADGAIERWYADARTRFEHAEWAHQLYATALELWTLSHEAAIAWADANTLDDADYRNALGLSRVQLRKGARESALRSAERALACAPEERDTWLQLAEAALTARKTEHAQAASAAVLELEPQNAHGLRILGLCHEWQGELARAVELHERASTHTGDPDAPLRAAIVRLRMHQFEQALDHAHEALERSPETLNAYLVAALAQQGLGDLPGSLALLERSISRLGARSELVQPYARGVARLEPAQREQRLARALQVWSEEPELLCSLAEALFEAGAHASGLRCFDAAAESNPNSRNPPWRRACECMQAGRLEDAHVTLSELANADPSNAYFAVLLDAVERKRGLPASFARLRRARPDAHPALLWGLMYRRASELGDEATRLAMEQRLFGLSPDDAIDAAWFCMQHRLLDEAEALIALAERHPRGQAESLARKRARHGLHMARDEVAAASALAMALHESEPELAVIDGELKSALCAREPHALERLARKRFEYVQRGAALAWGDGMHERGLIALAARLRGQSAAFDALQQAHGDHPALRALAKEAAS